MRHIGSTNKFLNNLIEYAIKNRDKNIVVYCRNFNSVKNYVRLLLNKIRCNKFNITVNYQKTIIFNDSGSKIDFIDIEHELRGRAIIDKLYLDVFKVENMQFGYLNSILKDTDIGDQYLFGE